MSEAYFYWKSYCLEELLPMRTHLIKLFEIFLNLGAIYFVPITVNYKSRLCEIKIDRTNKRRSIANNLCRQLSTNNGQKCSSSRALFYIKTFCVNELHSQGQHCLNRETVLRLLSDCWRKACITLAYLLIIKQCDVDL